MQWFLHATLLLFLRAPAAVRTQPGVVIDGSGHMHKASPAFQEGSLVIIKTFYRWDGFIPGEVGEVTSTDGEGMDVSFKRKDDHGHCLVTVYQKCPGPDVAEEFCTRQDEKCNDPEPIYKYASELESAPEGLVIGQIAHERAQELTIEHLKFAMRNSAAKQKPFWPVDEFQPGDEVWAKYKGAEWYRATVKRINKSPDRRNGHMRQIEWTEKKLLGRTKKHSEQKWEDEHIPSSISIEWSKKMENISINTDEDTDKRPSDLWMGYVDREVLGHSIEVNIAEEGEGPVWYKYDEDDLCMRKARRRAPGQPTEYNPDEFEIGDVVYFQPEWQDQLVRAVIAGESPDPHFLRFCLLVASTSRRDHSFTQESEHNHPPIALYKPPKSVLKAYPVGTIVKRKKSKDDVEIIKVDVNPQGSTFFPQGSIHLGSSPQTMDYIPLLKYVVVQVGKKQKGTTLKPEDIECVHQQVVQGHSEICPH